MNRICPVGFFCFDKQTAVLVVVIFIIATLYIISIQKYKYELDKIKNSKIDNSVIDTTENVLVDDYIHSIEKDHQRVVNPLKTPERSYPNRINHVAVPINIPTRGYIPQYQQIGVITKNSESEDPTILPLYGKPVYPGSSKWQYYTGTDKFNPVKLPITNNDRDCQGEYGCDEIYNGETVTVPAYGDSDFKTTIYKLDKPRYLPFIGI